MIRLLPIAVFTLLALALFAGLMQQKPDEPAKSGGALMGQTMPYLKLVDRNSTEASFDHEAQAGKVLLINFLASWCAPCEAEMGELVALKKNAPGVQFLGIAWNDGPAKIDPWLKEHGNPFDLMRFDVRGRAAMSLGMRGIPETFIIDSKGVVRYQLSGPLTERLRTQEVEPLLEQLQREAKQDA